MKQHFLEFYDDLDKARDRALWLEFEHRNIPKQFVVFDGPEDNFVVADMKTAEEMDITHHYYSLPETYEHLSYKDLEKISKDKELLNHWEELLGKFQVMEGELLRFILKYKIPLEKMIRHELGSRGFDENHQWIGFDESKKLWTGEN
ncbi:MAG: hypothetical protein QM564_06840 [Bergeyella sp.]